MNNLVLAGEGWASTRGSAAARVPRRRAGRFRRARGMTNTLNTPIEALELEYPMRVERYELLYGSGGEGSTAAATGW